MRLRSETAKKRFKNNVDRLPKDVCTIIINFALTPSKKRELCFLFSDDFYKHRTRAKHYCESFLIKYNVFSARALFADKKRTRLKDTAWLNGFTKRLQCRAFKVDGDRCGRLASASRSFICPYHSLHRNPFVLPVQIINF